MAPTGPAQLVNPRADSQCLSGSSKFHGTLRQAARLYLADELIGSFGEALARAVEVKHRGGSPAIHQLCNARAMSGGAKSLPELLGFRDQARWICSRPGEHDRRVYLEDAGEGRAVAIFAHIRTEIGSLVIVALLARVINSRQQYRSGDIGIGHLQFLVRKKTRKVECPDGIADGNDLARVPAEQVDVLMDP